MRVVTTKEELKLALKQKEQRIIVKGDLAVKMKRKAKTSKLISVAVAVAAIAAIPFTGGASAVGFVAGPVTISTVELAILVGGSIVFIALFKGYNKIKFEKDGSVIIEKN